MDSYQAITILILNIDAINGLKNILDRAARLKIIPEHINTYVFIIFIKRIYGPCHTFYRAAVAVRVPRP